MMNIPRSNLPKKTRAVKPRGLKCTPVVTLPICMNLASSDFPQMQSPLITTIPAGVARGAQLAVVSRNLHPKMGNSNKLYLIRRKEPDEAIEYGQLYLIETAHTRMFRIVNPDSACSVILKTCGIHGVESLYEFRKIRSMWRVCAIMDFAESKNDTEEY